MICDCCGAEYADNYLSCPYCGTATAVSDDTPDARCPRCSAPVMPGQPMCQQCGFALDLYQQRMQSMYSNQPPVMPIVEYDANGQPKVQNQYNAPNQYGHQGQYSQYNQYDQQNRYNWYNQPCNTNQAPYMQNATEKPKYNPNDPEQAAKGRVIMIMAVSAIITALISPIIGMVLSSMANTRARTIGYSSAQTVAIIAMFVAVINMVFGSAFGIIFD